jgi:hypothetical protein
MSIVRRVARIDNNGDLSWEDSGPSAFTSSYASNVYTINFPETFVDNNSVCVSVTPWRTTLTPGSIGLTARVYDITTTGCKVAISRAAVVNDPEISAFTIEVVGEIP